MAAPRSKPLQRGQIDLAALRRHERAAGARLDGATAALALMGCAGLAAWAFLVWRLAA